LLQFFLFAICIQMAKRKKSQQTLRKDPEVSRTVQVIRSKSGNAQLVEKLYVEFYQSVKDLLQKDGVSASNVIILIDQAMRVVGKSKTLEGPEKKALVITLVQRLIEESNLKPEDRAVVRLLAERALDPTIDQLFAMAPKVYGKVKNKCLSWCN